MCLFTAPGVYIGATTQQTGQFIGLIPSFECKFSADSQITHNGIGGKKKRAGARTHAARSIFRAGRWGGGLSKVFQTDGGGGRRGRREREREEEEEAGRANWADT